VLLPLLKGVAIGVIGGVVAAFNILVPVVRIVAGVLGWLGTKAAPIKPIIQGLGTAIGFIAGGPILAALGGLGKLGIVFRVVGAVVGAVGRVFVLFGRGALAAVRLLGRGAAAGFRLLLSGGRNVLMFFAGLPGRLIGFMVRAVAAVARGLGSLAGRILGIYRDAWGGIFRFLGGLAGKLIRAGVDIVSHIARGIAGAPAALRDALLDVLRGAVSHLPIPGFLKGRLEDALGIGAAAMGGYMRGGPTVVGEHGPELVNLPRGAHVSPHNALRAAAATFAAPAAAGAGGGVIHTHVYLNGREIASAVGRDTEDRMARR
jgi:hypothetical protein